jgi:delta24-sterol reductase
MNKIESHAKKIDLLQAEIKHYRFSKENSSPLTLHYSEGYSNTTRTKSYKNKCPQIDFSQFNDVLLVDPEKRIALVEPRVTMETLLQATLPFHLVPPVLPECKGITVGGAIMGGAGESSSHLWGSFNDICPSYKIIDGEGNLIQLSPRENQDLYYGIVGSYGSLGALVLAEIQLIPAQELVFLEYHVFSDAFDAIEKMKSLSHASKPPDFVDGIIFAKNLAVIMEGHLQPKDQRTQNIPLFSLKSPLSPWFYQHVKHIAAQSRGKSYREKMPIEDYFFRYDLGGFWLGAYLFQIPLIARLISQGIWNFGGGQSDHFNKSEIHQFYPFPEPHLLGRTLLRPFLNSQTLWALLHKAESWVQKRMIIQDFCIPESNALKFCEQICDNPAIFPIWLCPLKGTRTPQIFAPHLLPDLSNDRYLVNFGIYGISPRSNHIPQLTKMLEQQTHACGGRKTLYSRSYYTEKEFWQIYPHNAYKILREKTKANGIWHEITDKVLSE